MDKVTSRISKKTLNELDDMDEEVGEIMDFLDRLRQSATVNMSNAANELKYAYGMSKSAARELAKHWRETFQERHSEENSQ